MVWTKPQVDSFLSGPSMSCMAVHWRLKVFYSQWMEGSRVFLSGLVGSWTDSDGGIEFTRGQSWMVRRMKACFSPRRRYSKYLVY